ncbi:SDR family NAD(P)-dependent oxidoreductase [Patulibacter minatonensis]|uniref:SDR family NAD(P)-dependent oxidoreductase n=1 Tax=Patulibacter minatonensis TaxID=298163 RepID=UPI00047BE659|nr:SDR family NAD(P)-dependent oxidoreductase [Patulibacter minatonensis]
MSKTDGKVCAITGAGSGIGRALALLLAGKGARLALSDVNAAGIEETAALARKAGAPDVLLTTLNVADREAFFAWAAEVVAHFGVVHQIYNNAGVAHSRPVLESEWEDYERVLSINLFGVIHGTQAFLPHLIASGDGHVVNVSSLNGIMAQPEMSHYCASKYAVRGFTECLRMEMEEARHPVGVTSIHPGGIKTNISSAALQHARDSGAEITAKHEARDKLYREKLLKMDPAEAARVIVKGVEAGKVRVLVGNDAKAMDAVVRAIPSSYGKVLLAATKRMMKS